MSDFRKLCLVIGLLSVATGCDDAPVAKRDIVVGTINHLIEFDLRTRTERTFNLYAAQQEDAGSATTRVLGDGDPGVRGESPVPFAFTPFQDVADPAAPGFSAHVKIRIDESLVCSGTMIGSRHVLTAAHCFVSETGSPRVWAQEVKVFPALKRFDEPFGIANAVKLYTYSLFGPTEGGGAFHDVGIVELDRPVGFLTGWRRLGSWDDCDFWLSDGWAIIGYPVGSVENSDREYDGLQMVVRTGSHDRCEIPGYLVFENFTLPGMSGSGVLKEFQGTTYVWGVHIGGFWEEHKLGTSIYLDLFKWNTLYWIMDGARPISADLIVLDFEVPDDKIERAEVIDGMSVVVANVGKQPFSGNLNAWLHVSDQDRFDGAESRKLTFLLARNVTLAPSGSRRFPLAPMVLQGAGEPTGIFYYGLEIDVSDAVPANNLTRGSDAARIHVLHPGEFERDEEEPVRDPDFSG